MVSTYISLRLKQFARFYSFNGMHPLMGIPLTALLFVALSAYIYYRLPATYAAWVYCAVTIGAITELQNAKSNNFLKQLLSRPAFFKVKLPENLLILLPFVVMMCWQQSWLQLLVVVFFTIPYSFYNSKLPRPQLKAINTPYRGYAYEANFGFRTVFFAYVLYALLLVVGCAVQNVYLLLVPFFLLLFFIQTIYTKMEAPMYIWVYRTTAGAFLRKKFNTLAINYGITFAPFLLLGLVFYTAEWEILLLCFVSGLIATTGSMLIKYHFFQGGVLVQIVQFTFFACIMGGLAMPGMLVTALLFIPYSSWRAKANIKNILKC